MKKYRVTADSHQFVLNEVKTKGKESKRAGETFLEPVGYYTTLPGLVDGLGERLLRDACPREGWAPSELLQALAGVKDAVGALVGEGVAR